MLGFHPLSSLPVSAIALPLPTDDVVTGGGGGDRRKLPVGMRRVKPAAKGRPSSQSVGSDDGRDLQAEMAQALDAPAKVNDVPKKKASHEIVVEALSAPGKTQEQIIEEILLGDDEHLIIALLTLI